MLLLVVVIDGWLGGRMGGMTGLGGGERVGR